MYASLFRRCVKLEEGKRLHASILRNGLDRATILANLVVEMYGRCGALGDATSVFQTLEQPNVFSWTIMISAYAHHGLASQSLQLFKDLQGVWSLKADKVAFVAILQACTDLESLSEGKIVHACIILNNEFKSDIVLGTAIILLYGSCWNLEGAIEMFEKLSEENDVVLWNTMISVFVRCGFGNYALNLFKNMVRGKCMRPDKITFISVLKACTILADGRLIHYYVHASGLESDTAIQSALVNMYSRCAPPNDGDFGDPKCIISKSDAISHNIAIKDYAQSGRWKDAFKRFHKMQEELVEPNRITYMAMLDAFSSPAALAEGRLVHAFIIYSRLDVDIVIENSILHMYTRCKGIDDACTLFSNMSVRDVVSWTAILVVHIQLGNTSEAFHSFRLMQSEGVKPNKVSFITILDVCSTPSLLPCGRWLHASIILKGLDRDIIVGTKILHMYSKCGSLLDAYGIFFTLPERNVILWNTIITASAQHGQGQYALELYGNMLEEGDKPNTITFIGIIDGCSSLGILTAGKRFHFYFIGSALDATVVIGTALVTMYANCGNLEDACIVFDRMPSRNLVSWNAMARAFSQYGQSNNAAQLLKAMQEDGVRPQTVTFLHIINGHSYAGLVDDGWQQFLSMVGDYHIEPTLEHYSCMLDLLGRRGLLDESEDIIRTMPLQPEAIIWLVLLGICQIYDDLERGKQIADYLVDHYPYETSAYVVLSNLYASALCNR